jgi:hypothetical protein
MTMLGRLLVGILKGVVVGALVGFALVKLNEAVPLAVIAYLAAAVTGVLIGLVAGKPIWAKDAKIEAGMKAAVGALLGAALLYPVRRWLQMPLPFNIGELAGSTPGMGLGNLAMPSLAAVAAVLGGFYEADNTPDAGSSSGEGGAKQASGKQRIAAEEADDSDEEELDEDVKKQSKK